MKQRKKQPALTRSAILHAAGLEFSSKGYAGTGLGSIVSIAELTKGALFHHFPDKRALAVAWVAENLAASVNEVWVQPLGEIASLDALRALSRNRCMALQAGDATSALVALTAEMAASDPILADALEAVFSQWRASIASVLERGKTAAWIHHSIQPATEARFYVSVFSGFTVTTKFTGDEGIRRDCANALEGYLETLRTQ
jgi:TetR/AcrR family transcriptional regulator, transcriptional repressor for nem operon